MYPIIQQKIKELCHDGVFPGASYAFIKGATIDCHYEGLKQILPVPKPIAPNIRYDMASLTKVICTTTVLLKLLESGQIDLDRPLTDYLAGWTDSAVTLRHLLTHTSDINPYIKNRAQLDKQELRQALLQLKSGDSIGQKVVYTDTGTLLIGFLLEQLYQKPVQQIFIDEVLRPLNMTQSGFKLVDKTLGAPTELTANRGLIQGDVHDPKAFVLEDSCGSAGLFSTLEDSIKFVDMLLKRGQLPDGAVFLQAKTIEGLYQDWTPTRQGHRSLGWDLLFDDHKGHNVLYHTGYTGTFMIVDLACQEAFIFLSNRVHPVDKRLDYLAKRDELIGLYKKRKTD